MKLDGISSIKNLDFDIPNRKLFVFHIGEIDQIEKSISDLKLGGRKIVTEETDQIHFKENKNQRKLLWTVLAINFVFFIIEMTTGLLSKSMGIVADSLDMLADSFVYGISLFAVGGTLIRKKRIAKLAGYFQIILAVIGFLEVIRRFLGTEKLPDFSTMIVVSIFALIANGICLYLMQKSKSKEEAHMKASLIFTSNDIIINLGVIIAGVSVLSKLKQTRFNHWNGCFYFSNSRCFKNTKTRKIVRLHVFNCFYANRYIFMIWCFCYWVTIF